jgi:hypothetical protein
MAKKEVATFGVNLRLALDLTANGFECAPFGSRE